MGTESARLAGCVRGGRIGSKQPREGPIRTFGVSLVAIAAVAAGLVLSRYRGSNEPMKVPAGETIPVLPSLEAMRAAGM